MIKLNISLKIDLETLKPSNSAFANSILPRFSIQDLVKDFNLLIVCFANEGFNILDFSKSSSIPRNVNVGF